MKKFYYLSLAVMLILVVALTGCGGGNSGNPGGNPDNPGGGTNGIAVTFQSVIQTGGTSGSADSAALTFTFSIDPSTLSADNITVTGATKGALSGIGTTRSLAISDITVANGATVSVSITSPAGYSISGSPKTAVVYRLLTIGMDYQGGKIGYILQPDDPGYDANVPHGLIAAIADQSIGISWALIAFSSTAVPGGTSQTFGTGSSNTDKIIAQNGAGTGYSAGLARLYNGGGYTDWYLPSLNELHKLYFNSVAVGISNDTYYWSSSEVNNHYAYLGCMFKSGFEYQSDTKDNKPNRVRAVRSF